MTSYSLNLAQTIIFAPLVIPEPLQPSLISIMTTDQRRIRDQQARLYWRLACVVLMKGPGLIQRECFDLLILIS